MGIRAPSGLLPYNRDTNCVMDNMVRQAPEVWATMTLWEGLVPKNAPGNQLQGFYEQQGKKPSLDWVDLPKVI